MLCRFELLLFALPGATPKRFVFPLGLLDSLAWQWTVLLIESEGFDPHVGNH